MKPDLHHGWKIYFHPLFFQQWQDLLKRVKQLKNKLEPQDFISHPDVKLLKSIDLGIKEKIVSDPMASHFRLQGSLQKFSRLKKMGLPARYRLFFRVFPQEKSIIILWLGFPRKEGDQKDCYRIFEKMVKRGEFPQTIDELFVFQEKENLSDFEED